jgi:hypothetical protein
MFSFNTVYPFLRVLDLVDKSATDTRWLNSCLPLSKQGLQQLCSCCLALKSLRFVLNPESPPTALVQLLALTQLEVCRVDAALPVVISTAAQLPAKLKKLGVWCYCKAFSPTDPALLQLTTLTTLEEVMLGHVIGPLDKRTWTLRLKNKVGSLRSGFASSGIRLLVAPMHPTVLQSRSPAFLGVLHSCSPRGPAALGALQSRSPAVLGVLHSCSPRSPAVLGVLQS